MAFSFRLLYTGAEERKVITAVMMGKTRPREECIGCGYCCIQNPCSFCKSMYPHIVAEGEVCPLLEWNGERYICNLVTMPGKEGNYYRMMLWVGKGCRAYLNSWRRDVRRRNKNDRENSLDPSLIDGTENVSC
jgi:hypothetical protein